MAAVSVRSLLLLAALAAAMGAAPPAEGQGGDAPAGAISADVPPSPDPSRRYLLYLHGRILELRGRHAVSRQHGRYDYDGILAALADKGWVVISEVRPADTRLSYGEKVAGQARSLAAAGVPPESITVAGFSKGGSLALVASAALGHPRVRFAIMAGCGIGPWRQEILPGVAPRLRGRFLSLYDEADGEAGSCREAFAAAPGLESREIRLTTGRGHGLFYAPRREWLDPVFDWAVRRPEAGG